MWIRDKWSGSADNRALCPQGDRAFAPRGLIDGPPQEPFSWASSDVQVRLREPPRENRMPLISEPMSCHGQVPGGRTPVPLWPIST